MPVACAGERITAIELHRYAPTSRTAQGLARAAEDSSAGRRELTGGEPSLIAYVRLKVGEPCLEQDRADSERMLRAQRSVASAAVTALPDGPGRVRIRVDVVHEFPWVLGGSMRGISVQRVRFGSLDADGAGRLLIASLERGGAYRPGVGVEFAQPGVFGRPAIVTGSAERATRGGSWSFAAAEPFLANGQRHAFYAAADWRAQYARVVRPVEDDAFTRTVRGTLHLGWLQRIGRYVPDRPIGLAGLLLVSGTARTSRDLELVTDTGLVPTGDSTLSGRFPKYRASHLMGVGGFRALRFATVSRFDALRAEQDVAQGVEMMLVGGPSFGDVRTGEDFLYGAGLYAGRGDQTSFLSARARVEARSVGRVIGDWEGVVASARVSHYRTPSERRTRTVTLSASSIHRMPLPTQLTMRDVDGGLIAYGGSKRAGGRRVAVRVEERWLLTSPVTRADVALGVFGDAGRLWAGDVPYGAASPLLASVGVSLFGAYPSGGKRLYRVDIGVPLVRERGASGLVIVLSASDRTRLRWPEPRDVSRARVETGPATLVRW